VGEMKVINLEDVLKNFTGKKLDDKEFTKQEIDNAQVKKLVEMYGKQRSCSV
jgi:hypothetical protein